MFSVRLTEIALPAQTNDVDGLIDWVIDTLCLVRKRGEETADKGRAGPVHRLLKEYLFAHPQHGWDSQMLAEELGLTSASLNHHLKRLVEAGIIGFSTEDKGWRKYYVRGGSLVNALQFFISNSSLLAKQRLHTLEELWSRNPQPLPLELPEDEHALFTLGLCDMRPLSTESGADELCQWMGDFGLLGERPGKELVKGSISSSIFRCMLERNEPLSIDEAHEMFGGQKARLGRIMERFRSSGMVERVPRTDRLPVSLWAAMTSQHQKRGEDWLLKKGGFQRILSNEQQNIILSKLSSHALTVDDVETAVDGIDATEQMLLLNLLGGRLPLGYRLAGREPKDITKRVMHRLERLFSRFERVARNLDSLLLSSEES